MRCISIGILLIGAFVSLPESFASVASQKCSEVALRALYFDNDPKPLVVKGGDIFVSDEKYFSKFKKDESTTEVSSADGSEKITFQKKRGLVTKVVRNNDESYTLDGDCNLNQGIKYGTEVTYDRELCKGVSEIYSKNGLTSGDAFNCQSAAVGINELILKRNKELKKNSSEAALKLSTEFNALSYATECAFQMNFENKKDGSVNQAMVLSQDWYRSAFGKNLPKTERSKSSSTVR